MLLAAFVASSIHFYFAVTGMAQTGASPAPSTSAAVDRLTSDYHTVGSERGAMRYRAIWGIDNLKLEPIASGSLIRFSYQVVDAQKAQVLNDKKKDPYLLVEKNGAKLGVETAERVGQLRQVAQPESGRDYWMVFGNSRHLVQPGDRVDIVIGTFHAYGLFVEAAQPAVVGKR
jgi:hypothetical protein